MVEIHGNRVAPVEAFLWFHKDNLGLDLPWKTKALHMHWVALLETLKRWRVGKKAT